MRAPWTAAVAVPVLTALLVACGGDEGTSTSAPSPSATTSPTPTASQGPGGFIAIGHSGLTGTHSDPAKPDQEAPENSWATGTNKAVNSIATRLLALHPEWQGLVANYAVNGSSSDMLENQATSALQEVPQPSIVVVSTIDNDIRCDGSDAANRAAVAANVKAAVGAIAAASPSVKVLVHSQLGRPARYAAVIADKPNLRVAQEGTTPCSMFDPGGKLNPAHVANLTRVLEGYEKAVAQVCATLPQCVWDGGRASAFQDRVEYLSTDANHLNIRGHTAEAAWMWPLVQPLA